MRDTKPEVAEIRNAVHLCIFAPGGLWETPWMERVLPTIVDIVSRHQSWTIFTRFITPRHPEERPGQWQNYLHHWHQATRNHLAPSALEFVPALARYVPPLRIVDKPAYSAFNNPGLAIFLIELGGERWSSQAQKQQKQTFASCRRC
ncbi:nicotinamidase-related amidase [Bradyrhizobium sp. LB11.1]